MINMTITKKQIQMKKKYQNGDTDIIYPINRPKDVKVDDTNTLESYVTKVDTLADGATK